MYTHKGKKKVMTSIGSGPAAFPSILLSEDVVVPSPNAFDSEVDEEDEVAGCVVVAAPLDAAESEETAVVDDDEEVVALEVDVLEVVAAVEVGFEAAAAVLLFSPRLPFAERRLCTLSCLSRSSGDS